MKSFEESYHQGESDEEIFRKKKLFTNPQHLLIGKDATEAAEKMYGQKPSGQAEAAPVRLIPEAKDFLELFRALDATGGLQGSQKFYSVQELKDTINRVRTGELAAETITNTGGLRQRVAELLKIEQLGQQLREDDEHMDEKGELFRKLELLMNGKISWDARSYTVYYHGLVENVETLSRMALTRAEAQKILTVISSFEKLKYLRDPRDEARLKQLAESLERIMQ